MRTEDKKRKRKKFKITAIILFIAVVGIILYSVFSKKEANGYELASPAYHDIENKIYIPGNVYPIKEIEIKSQISGVLDHLKVSIGDEIDVNAIVATINMVPSSQDIEQLENNVNITKIELEAKQDDYNRNLSLYKDNVISKAEFEVIEKDYLVSKERHLSAKNQLSILKEGLIASKGALNTVKSSAKGVVIDIPIEEGASVIERNNYNPGTTIAILAEVNKFLFKAQISEQYLKYIDLGTQIKLTFNAYDSLTVVAEIVKIASKGVDTNGVIKYTIDAQFDITDQMPVMRSGYSSTAEITLERKENVLSIEEKYIHFKNDSIYVNVLDTVTQKPIEKYLKIGLSDGSFTEIIEGIDLKDKIITNYLR